MASPESVSTVPACPRCGSARVRTGTIQYADGEVPYAECLECEYFDLQGIPSYISPKITVRLSAHERKLPVDPEPLPISKQAGTIDPEGIATGRLPGRFTRISIKRQSP
ncbi:MAG: YheV family putative metal-binding protein [Chloroflexi bacterium]|nr:YheV family putative metal-binding protein [Chloroflexota bacterium]